MQTYEGHKLRTSLSSSENPQVLKLECAKLTLPEVDHDLKPTFKCVNLNAVSKIIIFKVRTEVEDCGILTSEGNRREAR